MYIYLCTWTWSLGWWLGQCAGAGDGRVCHRAQHDEEAAAQDGAGRGGAAEAGASSGHGSELRGRRYVNQK